jgi:uncharacterized DUF497 family protein
MKIHRIIWTEEQVDHIAVHEVDPEEVEQVFLGKSLVLRAKSTGPNPVYYLFGQTDSERYLFCVIIQFPDGNGFPVTARTMSEKEERRFKQWRRK